MTAGRPLLSVAIPLYRSARFVDTITANINQITYSPVEVIISDRHGDDDALDELRRRYGHDSRVRFLVGHDRADWVTHYNDLLREARGVYFCWMPHDDVCQSNYVEHLAAALERRPDAILAFGVMESVGLDIKVPVGPFTPPPFTDRDPWSLRTAFRLLLLWDLFRVVRGVVRREEVLRRGLFVPTVHETVHADVCWALALAVAAPFVFVPAASCTKQYRAGSASANWHYGVREAIDECRAMSAALWRSSHTRVSVAGGVVLLASVAAHRVMWRLVRPLIGRPGARIPRSARTQALRGLSWVLALRRAR